MKCLFVCHDIVKAGYTYDGSGRLRTLTNPFSEVTTLAYDADGREITRQLANGITVSNGYDANCRLVTRQHLNPGGGLLLGLTYSYNAANIRTGVAEVPGAVVTYTYDGSYQVLDNVRAPNPGAPGWAPMVADEWAELDADGWETLQVDGSSATDFTVNATYDLSGNPTAYATTLGQSVTATYDASNRLLSTTAVGSSTVVTTYAYDDMGNRTSSTTGSTVTHYAWDGDGRLTSQYGSATSPSRVLFGYDQSGLLSSFATLGGGVYGRLLWDGNVLVAQTDASGAIVESYTQLPGGFGGVISTREAGDSTSKFSLFDASGNTALVMDGSGAVVDSPVYDAFGNPVGDTEEATIFGWQGEQGYLAIGGYSPHANLYYVRQRWYDAVTRQWISADPIGMAGGDANLYRPVGNSMPSRTDPSGLVNIRKPRTYGSIFVGGGITALTRAQRPDEHPSEFEKRTGITLDPSSFDPFAEAPYDGKLFGPFKDADGNLVPRARVIRVIDHRTYSVPGRFWWYPVNREYAQIAATVTGASVDGEMEIVWTTEGVHWDMLRIWQRTQERFKDEILKQIRENRNFTLTNFLGEVLPITAIAGFSVFGIVREAFGVAGIASTARKASVSRKIYTYTDDISKIRSSGRVWGQTEGSVYGMPVPDAHYRAMTKPTITSPQDPGLIIFEGEAAGMFKPHSIEGPYSGMKRLLGQEKAPFGDIIFDPNLIEVVNGNTIIIRQASIGSHAGQSELSAAARLWGRRLGIEPAATAAIAGAAWKIYHYFTDDK
jgi:RHS repeat-associated protein